MPRLEVQQIEMQFPAVKALDGVSVSFEPGEVHGIIGENGAGKSTLMKILSGLQPPSAGQILLDGEPVKFRGVGDALRHGIAMIHQELNLVDDLDVAENIFLGREKLRLGLLDRQNMRTETVQYLDAVGASFGPGAMVSGLSIANKQLVEIAKALSYEASILIMDEPTAVLSELEAKTLFELIRKLKEKGTTVVYISHRLAEVEEICDRITVLRDGQLVALIDPKTSSQTEMANLMVGRPLGDMFPVRSPIPDSEFFFTAQEISDGEIVTRATIAVRQGEIVGLAGLVGSGRTELAEILCGARNAVKGSIEHEGKSCHFKSPRDGCKSGIAYVSEDRKDIGLILSLDTIKNTTIANLKSYANPLLQFSKEESSTKDWIKKLDISVGDINAPVLFLSGGNQQKVSLAKWLELKPKTLILDEPTRGVDVGAKTEIYALISSLAKDGLACIVISSEMQELIGLCHRIVVMRNGETVGELLGSDMTEQKIMMLASGVA